MKASLTSSDICTNRRLHLPIPIVQDNVRGKSPCAEQWLNGGFKIATLELMVPQSVGPSRNGGSLCLFLRTRSRLFFHRCASEILFQKEDLAAFCDVEPINHNVLLCHKNGAVPHPLLAFFRLSRPC